MKDIAAFETIDERTALIGFGIIQYRHPNAPDIVINDVTKNKHHNERHYKHQRAIALVVEKLNEFLAYQFPDSKPTHRPSFFSILKLKNVSTKNMISKTSILGHK
jgi:hypothetical protein